AAACHQQASSTSQLYLSYFQATKCRLDGLQLYFDQQKMPYAPISPGLIDLHAFIVRRSGQEQLLTSCIFQAQLSKLHTLVITLNERNYCLSDQCKLELSNFPLLQRLEVHSELWSSILAQ